MKPVKRFFMMGVPGGYQAHEAPDGKWIEAMEYDKLASKIRAALAFGKKFWLGLCPECHEILRLISPGTEETQEKKGDEENRTTYRCDTCGDILNTKKLIEGHICTNCGGHWQHCMGYILLDWPAYIEHLAENDKLTRIQKLVEGWKCTKKMDEDEQDSPCPAHYADYPCRCDNDQREAVLDIITGKDRQFYEKAREMDEIMNMKEEDKP